MWGWIIPIGLIILGLILSGNASEVITVFSDNSTSTRKEDNGGCFFCTRRACLVGNKDI